MFPSKQKKREKLKRRFRDNPESTRLYVNEPMESEVEPGSAKKIQVCLTRLISGHQMFSESQISPTIKKKVGNSFSVFLGQKRHSLEV